MDNKRNIHLVVYASPKEHGKEGQERGPALARIVCLVLALATVLETLHKNYFQHHFSVHHVHCLCFTAFPACQSVMLHRECIVTNLREKLQVLKICVTTRGTTGYKHSENSH